MSEYGVPLNFPLSQDKDGDGKCSGAFSLIINNRKAENPSFGLTTLSSWTVLVSHAQDVDHPLCVLEPFL